MVMKSTSRKRQLGLGVLAAYVMISGFGPSGARAANEEPDAQPLIGNSIVDLPKEVGPTAESMLGDYLAGNFALDSGNIKDAVGYFQRALADDPDNLELRRQVFLLDLADGRYDDALDEAKVLAENDPQDANEDAQLLLALEQAVLGAFDDVPDALKDVSDRGIVALATPFIQAWSLVAGQRSDDALDGAVSLLHGGESLGPLNDFHEAMLLALGDRAEDALEKMKDILPETGPAPVRVAQAYAELLVREGRNDEALTFLQDQIGQARRPALAKALADLEAGGSPGFPFDGELGGMADALLGIAEALQQERGSARAVLYARLALYLQPGLAEGQILIGDTLAGQENLDAAIDAYDAIDPQSPLGAAAKIRKAQTLHEKEDKETAFKLLEEIADADPKKTDALIELGNLLRRDEQYQRAEHAYSRAIERLDEARTEHWTLFYSRGISFERTERWPEAEADFLHALELQPEQPFVLNYLGYSWVDQGLNLDQAKDMLHRAVDARPDDGFIVDSLGWVYYRLKEYDKAVDSLERAVVLQPGDPVINDHLGDAYWKVGREREAIFQWQRALTLDPEEDVIATIREKLESGLDDDQS